MKGKGKRILSGLLSLLTILTSVVQPVVTYAAEPEPAGYEAQYPVDLWLESTGKRESFPEKGYLKDSCRERRDPPLNKGYRCFLR